ncbi:hypothetical protein GCM10023143_09260 [Compostibacter hankyongensis]|uniref:Glycosyl hydrolases family 2 sugar binding domain-containing protein n=1 Tax=Compostibacter hankyongensis TaxID=1007089 RepID=A0ABP8FJ04_9BACT
MFLFLAAAVSCSRQQREHPADLAAFTPSADLEKDFKHPPDQNRPWAFWWWLEGNIDSAGIRKDLSEMKKVGIRGAIIFDAGSSSYTDVRRTAAGPAFMSPAWRKLFAYANAVADSLQLQLSLNIGSGWNDGGPWVTPELASQKLTWSRTDVKGGASIRQQMPLPGNVFRYGAEQKPFFKPVATLAIRLGDSSPVVTPLKYFDLKAVHRVTGIRTPDGYDWSIFLQEDSATLQQHNARIKDVIDISDKTDSSGNLSWDAPPGDYALLWFGYTGTGAKVSTSSPGGEGLAIDYMNPAAMDLQFEKVPGVLIRDIGPLAGRSLKYLHDDSWELGAANWTPGFREAFRQKHGYDLLPYLPVMAGWILENKDVSNRFLTDFRRTIADLIAQNHYTRFRQLAHARGLGIHPEGGGPHPAPIDALLNLGINDVPMGEFWARVKTHRVQDFERIFVKQSASAAHVYGRRYVQAEGPTSIGPQWEMDPRRLKPTIDRAFCEGLNRLVFHTFTHSPDSAGLPGFEYFAGTHFNPNITWWKQAPAYVDYIARCQLLLQQGLFVGDVCYYYGDNVPNQVHLKRTDPSLGEGYDYDVANTDVLLNRMSVKDHRIFLPDGMHYEVLVLPPQKTMTLPVLKKIRQLVKEGATVIGPRPRQAAGLDGYPQADKTLEQIADEVWRDADGVHAVEHVFGKGKVVCGKTIRTVLQERGVVPDFVARDKKLLQDIDYIHRSFGKYEIYFLSNRRDTAQWLTAGFRVTGAAPQLWQPDNGSIVPQAVYDTAGGHTLLPLYLPPEGSIFVIFRKGEVPAHLVSVARDGRTVFPFATAQPPAEERLEPAADGQLMTARPGQYTLKYAGGRTRDITLTPPPAAVAPDSAWRVYFSPEWGGPGGVTMDSLISWPKSTVTGIRYYSGTAVYRNTFSLQQTQLQEGRRVMLDLGSVQNLAEVSVNGKPAGVLWKLPFALDVTPWIKAGRNTVEIRVANLWPNRIIGDQQLPPGKRYTRTNVIKFKKDYPLLPSGLLGPVRVRFVPMLPAE